jgi:tight adherence protein C
MTFLLMTVGVILIAVSGRLVMLAISAPRLALKAHLRDVANYGFDLDAGQEDDAGPAELGGKLSQLAEKVGGWAIKRVPALAPLKLNELSAAGYYDMTTERMHGYRVLGATCLPLLFFLMLATSGLSPIKLLLVMMTGVLGWKIPAIMVHRRGKARLDEIDRQLPDVIDLLIATVEAGMGFGSALDLVASRYRGALGDEMRLTMKQQRLGIAMTQGLEDMGERCDTPSMRAFVRTATRGESMGVSIGPILRELSIDMRLRRRQTAREKMQKAPIKMIFPLMFLVMPALMIVIMYPAAYSVAHNLSGI